MIPVNWLTRLKCERDTKKKRSFPMSIAKNNNVTKTQKTNAFVQPIEALENRQMMSASVPHVPAFLPADVQQTTVHANNGHAKTNHGASNGTISTLTLV